MADIFISYAREDAKVAERLALDLKKHGWTVFWDQGIQVGRRFADVIAKELGSAGCVIVLWSRSASASNWVLDEAGEALKRNVLAPAFIEAIDPPMGFRQIHTADLIGWHGEESHGGFQRLLKDIERFIPASPSNLVPEDDGAATTVVRRVLKKLALLIPKSRLVRYEIVLACLGASLFYAYLILSVQPRPCRWEASELSKAGFADEYLLGKKYWSAPESWQVEKGKWMFVTGPGIGWLRERIYEDFLVFFPIKLANRKGAVWIIRSQNDENYYMFQLLGPAGSPPNTFRTFIRKNGKLEDKSTNSIVADLSNPDDWIRIRVEVTGNKISHLIEVPSQPSSKPKLIAELEDSNFLCGRIGLGSKDGEEFYAGPIVVVPQSHD